MHDLKCEQRTEPRHHSLSPVVAKNYESLHLQAWPPSGNTGAVTSLRGAPPLAQVLQVKNRKKAPIMHNYMEVRLATAPRPVPNHDAVRNLCFRT